MFNLNHYTKSLKEMNKKDLEEEMKKLVNLYSNVFQEYQDREETLILISSKMDKVRAELSYIETKDEEILF